VLICDYGALMTVENVVPRDSELITSLVSFLNYQIANSFCSASASVDLDLLLEEVCRALTALCGSRRLVIMPAPRAMSRFHLASLNGEYCRMKASERRILSNQGF